MVSKRLHSGYTKCNLWWTNALFNIMVALAMYELCAPPTMVGDAAWHKQWSRSLVQRCRMYLTDAELYKYINYSKTLKCQGRREPYLGRCEPRQACREPYRDRRESSMSSFESCLSRHEPRSETLMSRHEPYMSHKWAAGNHEWAAASCEWAMNEPLWSIREPLWAKSEPLWVMSEPTRAVNEPSWQWIGRREPRRSKFEPWTRAIMSLIEPLWDNTELLWTKRERLWAKWANVSHEWAAVSRCKSSLSTNETKAGTTKYVECPTDTSHTTTNKYFKFTTSIAHWNIACWHLQLSRNCAMSKLRLNAK